jgi:hypothetical protein
MLRPTLLCCCVEGTIDEPAHRSTPWRWAREGSHRNPPHNCDGADLSNAAA